MSFIDSLRFWRKSKKVAPQPLVLSEPVMEAPHPAITPEHIRHGARFVAAAKQVADRRSASEMVRAPALSIGEADTRALAALTLAETRRQAAEAALARAAQRAYPSQTQSNRMQQIREDDARAMQSPPHEDDDTAFNITSTLAIVEAAAMASEQPTRGFEPEVPAPVSTPDTQPDIPQPDPAPYDPTPTTDFTAGGSEGFGGGGASDSWQQSQ